MMKFDLPHDNSSIIKVIGVGGGGSNAVNHMYKLKALTLLFAIQISNRLISALFH
jgi:cell division protein FtsZ